MRRRKAKATCLFVGATPPFTHQDEGFAEIGWLPQTSHRGNNDFGEWPKEPSVMSFYIALIPKRLYIFRLLTK